MTPYVDFTYFLFLLYPLTIAVVLGVLGLLGRRFILLASIGMLLFQVGNPLGETEAAAANLQQLAFLGGYTALSLLVVFGFALIRRRTKLSAPLYLALGLALLPLLLVRVYPLATSGHWFGLAAALARTGATPGIFDAFGFLGISYMTFRAIDAIVAINDELVKEPPTLVGLTSYLLFFPTFSAGPVDRYQRFIGNLKGLPRSRSVYLLDVEAGISRIVQGFVYKFIIAYLIDQYALIPAAKASGLLGNAEYAWAYLLYLFFDFAGYSAFAIGVGRFFGIEVPENFDAPFRSRNFRELWNRWHKSLSSYLRAHIYMRFMYTATQKKWLGGNRFAASYVGLFLTMFVMGAWHGFALHYLAYGAFQGVMLVATDVVGRWNRQRKLIATGWLADVGGVFLTLNLFAASLLLFSGHLFDT